MLVAGAEEKTPLIDRGWIIFLVKGASCWITKELYVAQKDRLFRSMYACMPFPKTNLGMRWYVFVLEPSSVSAYSTLSNNV